VLGKLRLPAEKNWPADERRYPQIRKHLLAESRENTENFRLGLRLVRVDLNSLTESVIGSAFEVSNTLVAGFLEKVYERALVNELGLRGITAATQTTYPVAYKGHVIAEFQPDMVVENILIVAAIVGNLVGYWTGRRAGTALYSRQDSRFFKRRHLERTRDFYERHGGKTIVITRFMPIVRTFAPIVAGAAPMPFARFATYNVVGAILWVISLTVGGYTLGRVIPDIDSKIHIVVAIVIVLSFVPGIVSWLRNRSRTAG